MHLCFFNNMYCLWFCIAPYDECVYTRRQNVCDCSSFCLKSFHSDGDWELEPPAWISYSYLIQELGLFKDGEIITYELLGQYLTAVEKKK